MKKVQQGFTLIELMIVVAIIGILAAVCERAAEIRVASSLTIKLPDALHLAAALEHGCGLFLTNDMQLAGCAAIAIEVLT